MNRLQRAKEDVSLWLKAVTPEKLRSEIEISLEHLMTVVTAENTDAFNDGYRARRNEEIRRQVKTGGNP
jgi:hypothetical protein